MEWSLSIQFNPFLAFLLSQEMFKEIYVAVWKSEFLISDTEKEITVRKDSDNTILYIRKKRLCSDFPYQGRGIEDNFLWFIHRVSLIIICT